MGVTSNSSFLFVDTYWIYWIFAVSANSYFLPFRTHAFCLPNSFFQNFGSWIALDIGAKSIQCGTRRSLDHTALTRRLFRAPRHANAIQEWQDRKVRNGRYCLGLQVCLIHRCNRDTSAPPRKRKATELSGHIALRGDAWRLFSDARL